MQELWGTTVPRSATSTVLQDENIEEDNIFVNLQASGA